MSLWPERQTNGQNIQIKDAHWSEVSYRKNQTAILNSSQEIHVYVFYIYVFCGQTNRPTDNTSISME